MCVYTGNEDNQIECEAIKQVNKQTRYTCMMMADDDDDGDDVATQ